MKPELRRKLESADRVRVPDLWDRIEARARVGRSEAVLEPARTQQRVAAAVVAFAVFAGAAAFAWLAFGDGPNRQARSHGEGGDALVMRVTAEPGQQEAPRATFVFGGSVRILPPQGGKGWNLDDVVFNAVGYALPADVPGGAPIRIESNATRVRIEASPCCPPEDAINLIGDDGAGEVPTKPGEYMFVATASWPDGTAEYTIIIHVAPTTPASAPSSPTDATSTEATTPRPQLYGSPSFQDAPGWDTYTTGRVKEGSNPLAWTANIGIDGRDLPIETGFPLYTLQDLPPGGIVVTVISGEPWKAPIQPTRYTPVRDLPLQIKEGIVRRPEAEEPAGDYTVIDIDGIVQEQALHVGVYIGSADPTPEQLEAAQHALNRLLVPPLCPATDRNAPDVTLSTDTGVPGATINLSMRRPLYRKDGTYDPFDRFEIWWNVRPDTAFALTPGSTVEPSPSGAGDVEKVAKIPPAGSCTAEGSFTVPNVPPGDYPIVVVDIGTDSLAVDGVLTFHVTA
jgi:hypothetical protein